MYGKAAGISTLPATGGMVLFPHALWYIIAMFAIVVALGAVWRMLPRTER